MMLWCELGEIPQQVFVLMAALAHKFRSFIQRGFLFCATDH